MQSTGLATNMTFTGLSLVADQRYYVTVNASNSMGLVSATHSDGFVLGDVPETSALVVAPVGSRTIGQAVDMQSDSSALSVCFEPFLASLGTSIELYEAALGTSSDLGDVVDFAALDATTQETTFSDGLLCVHWTGLALKQANTYYASVRARATGNYWASVSSRPVTIDTTAPVAQRVWLPQGAGFVNVLTDQLPVAWLPFVEDTARETQLRLVTVAIVDVLADTPAGPVLSLEAEVASRNGDARSVTLTGLTLVGGRQYRADVTATNLVDLTTTASSQPFLYDYTPPSSSYVSVTAADSRDNYDALGLRPNASDSFVTTPLRLCIAFGFSDDESGLTAYQVRISRSLASQGVTTVLDSGLLSLPLAFYCARLPLEHLATYRVEVRALNGAGLLSAWLQAPPTIAVLRGPRVGIVLDGTGATDQEYVSELSSGTEVCATWNGFSSHVAVGLASYVLDMVLRDPISGLVSSVLSDSVTIEHNEDMSGGGAACVTLSQAYVHGNVVYSRVRASNRAEQVSEAISNGVIVDMTPPTSGDLIAACNITAYLERRAGENIAVDWYEAGPTVPTLVDGGSDACVAWRDIVDDESGVNTFVVSVGTSAGGDDIIANVSVGRAHLFPMARAQLGPPSTMLYLTVVATNNAGLERTITGSEPFVLDDTPAVVSQLEVKSALAPVRGTLFQTTTAQICVEALSTQFASDPETGVRSVSWDLVDVYGGNATVIGTGVILRADAALLCVSGSSALEDGHVYFVRVYVENGAGMVSEEQSDRVQLDTEPASLGTLTEEFLVNGTAVTDSVLVNSTEGVLEQHLCVNWRDAQDTSSGLLAVKLRLETSGGTLIEEIVNEGASVNGTAARASSEGGSCFGAGDVSVSLVHGASYIVRALAKDYLDQWGAEKTITFSVDDTPPVFDTDVVIVSSTGATASAAVFSVTWTVSDPESAVVSCEWGISSVPNAFDVYGPIALPVDECSLGVVNTAQVGVNGVSVSATVRISNGVGQVVSKSSTNMTATPSLANGFDEVFIDTVAPEAGTLYTGSLHGTNDSFSSNTSAIFIAFDQFIDVNSLYDLELAVFSVSDGVPQEGTETEWPSAGGSDVSATVRAHYVGTLSGTEVRPFRNIPADDVARGIARLSDAELDTVTGALPTGVRLVSCMRARDSGSLYSAIQCNRGTLLDTTPPTAGTVSDGFGGTDIDVQGYLTSLAFTWEGFFDAESAPLQAAIAAIGELPSVKSQNSTSLLGSLDYVPGRRAGGLFMKYDVTWSTSSDVTDIFANKTLWTRFLEDTDTFAFTELSLTYGVTYYIHVCGFNPAGLSVCAVSDGVTPTQGEPGFDWLSTDKPDAFAVWLEGSVPSTDPSRLATHYYNRSGNALVLARSPCVAAAGCLTCTVCLTTVNGTSAHTDYSDCTRGNVSMTSPQTSDSVVLDDASAFPLEGVLYGVSVQCCTVNGVDGCRRVVANNSLVIDTSAPSVSLCNSLGVSCDVIETAFSVSNETGGLSVLQVMVDDDESGVDSSSVSWDWSGTPPASGSSNSSLSAFLAAGTTAASGSLTVTATNGAGVSTTRTFTVSAVADVGVPASGTAVVGDALGSDRYGKTVDDVVQYIYAQSLAVELRADAGDVNDLAGVAYRVLSVAGGLSTTRNATQLLNAFDAATGVEATEWIFAEAASGSLDAIVNVTTVFPLAGRTVRVQACWQRTTGLRTPVASCARTAKAYIVDGSRPAVTVWEGRGATDVTVLLGKDKRVPCGFTVVKDLTPITNVSVCVALTSRRANCSTWTPFALDSTKTVQHAMLSAADLVASVDNVYFYCHVRVTNAASLVQYGRSNGAVFAVVNGMPMTSVVPPSSGTSVVALDLEPSGPVSFTQLKAQVPNVAAGDYQVSKVTIAGGVNDSALPKTPNGESVMRVSLETLRGTTVTREAGVTLTLTSTETLSGKYALYVPSADGSEWVQATPCAGPTTSGNTMTVTLCEPVTAFFVAPDTSSNNRNVIIISVSIVLAVCAMLILLVVLHRQDKKKKETFGNGVEFRPDFTEDYERSQSAYSMEDNPVAALVTSRDSLSTSSPRLGTWVTDSSPLGQTMSVRL
jgi:hypothetical protein